LEATFGTLGRYYIPFVLMMVGVFLFVLLIPIIKLLRRTGHHAIGACWHYCRLELHRILDICIQAVAHGQDIANIGN